MTDFDGPPLYIEKDCPFCGEHLKAFPRRMFDEQGWCDYNSMRTNRVSIEFEVVHKCGDKS